jgi:hypothetical protein
VSKAASNPTRVAHEASISHHRQQQQLKASMGLGMVKIDNPNRAQRRAAKKQGPQK